MKELKTYISEGFFSNVGANNIIKPVIDAIKDASMNSEIKSPIKRHKFIDLLKPILKDIENNMRKGKIVFEYIRNDEYNTVHKHKVTISLEKIPESSKPSLWIYDSDVRSGLDINNVLFNISMDLFYESVYPIKDPRFHHSIANTIKITEFKVS